MTTCEWARLATCGALLALSACDRALDITANERTPAGESTGFTADSRLEETFQTWFELRCRPGHVGTGTFSVTRNNVVLVTITRTCTAGKTTAAVIVTAVRPNDWRMILTVTRLSDGRRRTCEYKGTEFPATRRCFPSPQGITASVTTPRLL